MEITEEQRRRAETNRLIADEKRRKRLAENPPADPFRLFPCQKIPRSTSPPDPITKPDPNPPPPRQPPSGFRVVVEICSPTEFSVSFEPRKDFSFPGDAECSERISACLSSIIPVRLIESKGAQTLPVYRLDDHEIVLRCLKKLVGIELKDIPHITLSVVRKFQGCDENQWNPLWNGHFSDAQVDELLEKLPKLLRDSLLPFQLEGVRFSLRRGGRSLIADEMGLGKTLQAIAIACCFLDEGPILVVCPAILRYTWAEEFERWLPFLLPKDVHLVFGRQDSLDRMGKNPKVTVISYKMLSRLRKSMLERRWALLIVDESHNIRCTKKKMECAETQAVIDVAKGVNRIILLSGTPSLSRPYDIYHQINILWPRLLGTDKYDFASIYCLKNTAKGFQGKAYQDFSKGVRLEELNVLLSQTLMIRRLKEQVLKQLPPKRRQIVRLELMKDAKISLPTSRSLNEAVRLEEHHYPEESNMNCSGDTTDVRGERTEGVGMTYVEQCGEKSIKQLSLQEIGLGKLSGFFKWFNHTICRVSEDLTCIDMDLGCQKMVIFAHHLSVLDGLQEFICGKGIQFVRIDGRTLPRDRQAAVTKFRLLKEFKIALVGITAGGVGLDFTAAHHVVFLELPKTASEMLQAEDRCHRRGQTNAVSIYIFCAKETIDESHWSHLNKSLFRVSTMMNGQKGAIDEIQVDKVSHLDHSIGSSRSSNTVNVISSQLSSESSGLGTESVKWGSQAIKSCNSLAEECRADDIEPEENGSTPIDCLEKAQTFNNRNPSNPDDETSELGQADTDCAIQLETLRFEVSKHTGRIHLYVCIPGKDSRPRPIFINFRPEELESVIDNTGTGSNRALFHLLKENPEGYEIFQAFNKEWSGLRSIDKNKLYGKPLQLPLSLELCYLKETINHGSGGLLKGGSKRRVTPKSDMSHTLKENAVWKKVALSRTASDIEYTQAWTTDSEPLCKLCQEPCKGKLGKAPEYFEDLFCNLNCFQEYRIRTSRSALREELFRIEHGVCTRCQLDCHKLVECIRPLSIPRREEYIDKLAPNLANRKKLFDKLVKEPIEGNAWHADHIIPVYKGGGECRLENMRTLCVACHAETTAEQQKERKLEKKKAKEQLKSIMQDLDAREHSTNGSGDKEAELEASEDDLFVEVPGSDYARKESIISL